MAGTAFGAVTVKVTELETLPLSFKTVIWAKPEVVRRFVGSSAVSIVELTKVVDRLMVCPFRLHCTAALPAKPVPFTVKLIAGESTGADDGFKEVIVKSGATLIVNGTAKSSAPLS